MRVLSAKIEERQYQLFHSAIAALFDLLQESSAKKKMTCCSSVATKEESEHWNGRSEEFQVTPPCCLSEKQGKAELLGIRGFSNNPVSRLIEDPRAVGIAPKVVFFLFPIALLFLHTLSKVFGIHFAHRCWMKKCWS